MALSLNPYDSYSVIDQMMREMDYRMQKQMREMQYQMQYQMYPTFQNGTTAVAPSPKKDEKKEKLHNLIAHYYHLRKPA